MHKAPRAGSQGKTERGRSPLIGDSALEFADRILTCTECGAEFVFSAGEQSFFYDKHFTNDPKHCKNCKANRPSRPTKFRVEVRAVCAACGAETMVPFQPTQGRPVLCRTCFLKSRHHPTSPGT
jgi:CxxC-x17-CxxC domain-containing protein